MKKLTLTMTILLITTITAIGQIPYKGLVAFFPFSGNYNDISGNDIVVDAASDARNPVSIADHNGTPNAAYKYDGYTQALRGLSTEKLPAGNTDLTISSWIYTQNGGVPRVITSWGTDTIGKKNAIVFYHTSIQGDLYLGLTNGTDSVITKSPTNTFVKWAHVAVTFNNGSATFYANGTALETKNITLNINVGGVFGIATNWISERVSLDYFGGYLDDIAIYSRALTGQEIKYIKDCNSTIQVKVLPKITSTPITIANVNQKYSMKVETNGIYTISIQTKPVNMTLVGGNTVEWTPAAYQVGPNKVKIVAKNTDGDSAIQEYTINVIPPTSIINTGIPNRSITNTQNQISYSLDGRQIKQNNNIRGLILNQKIKRLIVK